MASRLIKLWWGHPSFLLSYLTLFAVIAALWFAPRELTAEAMLSDVPHYGRHHHLGCHVLNTYRERAKPEDNGGIPESDEALMATAWTVKTRLEIGFHQAGNPIPENLCDVVWEWAQYSWTRWSDTRKFTIDPVNHPEFERAFAAAKAVQAETPAALKVRQTIGAADHYFNSGKVDATWAKRMTFTATVGLHDFYVAHQRFSSARKRLERKYAQASPP